MPSAPISAVASSWWRAMPLRWTTVSPLACAVTSSNWQPSLSSISGWSSTAAASAALQVGAMHHPIGCAGAKTGGLAERQPRDFAAMAGAHDADGVGDHRAPGEPRLQTEFDQHPAGIGRQLQAGAGFLEPLGLLQHDDAKTLRGERQRRRQSPDPGTSDDDGARDSHRSVRRPCPSPRIRGGGPRRP